MACDFDHSPIGIYNFTDEQAVPQGATYVVDLTYKENDVVVDFSTYTAKMQVRQDYDKPVLLELTTANGGIVVSDSSPNVQLVFTPSRTSSMNVYKDMIYDLELYASDGSVVKFVAGKFELFREVTK